MVSQDINKAVEYMETAISKDSSCIQAYSTLATIEMQRSASVMIQAKLSYKVNVK